MASTTTSRGPRRFPRVRWTFLLLTSLGVALYFPLQYARGSLASLVPEDVGLASTYADRPWPVQVAFYAHITFAGLALLVGPFQFSQTIRHRHVRVHRAVGRVYVVAVVLGGTAAFVMSCFSSVGLLGFFGFGSLAVLWVVMTLTAYRAVRRGDVASHQAFMMRSFALTYAAPTLRLWLFALLIPQLVAGVPFASAYSTAYAPVPFLSWLPNLVVVELMIRRRGLPALRLSPSPTAPAAVHQPAGVIEPTSSRTVEPPARRLRLLADLALGAAVVFGLLTLWLVVSAATAFVQLVGGQGAQPGAAVWLRVVLLVVGLVMAALTALVTYRLAVDVPRTVRRWDEALAERVQVLRDR